MQHHDQSSYLAHRAQGNRRFSIVCLKIIQRSLASRCPVSNHLASNTSNSAANLYLDSHFHEQLVLTFTDTTRSPRPGERDGIEYNFVTKDAFNALVNKNGFIEHAQFGSNSYGTSFAAVEDIAKKGRICILDIEMEVGPPYVQEILDQDCLLLC